MFGGTAGRDLASLLAAVGELYARVEARDLVGVTWICEREALWIPRDVREEALAVAATALGGHRAPLRLLLFWRSARALEADAHARAAQREQLELDLPEDRFAAPLRSGRLRSVALGGTPD